MDYGSAVQRAGILTTNEGFRRALRFEKTTPWRNLLYQK
jgi:hypothetical protein